MTFRIDLVNYIIVCDGAFYVESERASKDVQNDEDTNGSTICWRNRMENGQECQKKKKNNIRKTSFSKEKIKCKSVL